MTKIGEWGSYTWKYKNSSIQEGVLQITPINSGSKCWRECPSKVLGPSGGFQPGKGSPRSAPWVLSPAQWSFLLVSYFTSYFDTLPIFLPCLLLPNFPSSSLFTNFCLILCTLFIGKRAHNPEPHQNNLVPDPPGPSNETMVSLTSVGLLYTGAPSNILLNLLWRNSEGLIRRCLINLNTGWLLLHYSGKLNIMDPLKWVNWPPVLRRFFGSPKQ